MRTEIKRSLEFPTLVFCSHNRIHCGQLRTLISECENQSECTRKDFYCKFYIKSECYTLYNTTMDTICEGYSQETVEIQSNGKYNVKGYTVGRLLVELTGNEMKRMAHLSENLFVSCKFGGPKKLQSDNVGKLACDHLRKQGGALVLSISHGICYSFNMKTEFEIKTTSNETKDILRQNMAGPNGLELRLNIEGSLKPHVL